MQFAGHFQASPEHKNQSSLHTNSGPLPTPFHFWIELQFDKRYENTDPWFHRLVGLALVDRMSFLKFPDLIFRVIW
jgi:hypothetical protein